MRLVCNNCGYRFTSEKSNRRCPYCGKDNVEKERDAEELLKQMGTEK